MGANHHHSHTGKNILLAFFLNASFAIIELIGGYFTNSVAIYSDALHDFGDSLALLFSYFAEKASHREADKKFTFGYRRLSVVSALVNGVILLLGSMFVIYEAVKRLNNPEPVVPEGMLGLAILGIVVNGFAAYRLSKEDGLNPRMVMYHLIEDILGWVAVFIVSIILLFKPWFVLDSILSILISLLILRGVYKALKKVFLILLQAFPDDIQVDELSRDIQSIESVIDVHAIKGWSLDEDNFYLRLHIQMSGETVLRDVDEIKRQVKNILEKYKVTQSTIEFESDSSRDRCCEVENRDLKKARVIPGRLCYCFQYSEDDFRVAISKNKESDLLDDIKTKMKDPGCFCETANPSGKCCLADINKFIKEEKSK